MFCDECGSILVPDDEDGFSCPRCGCKGKDVDLSEESKSNKEIVIVREGDEESMPKADVKCRKCGHKQAFFFVYQTRSADEAPTTFYTCCKCGNRWRDYG